MRLKRPTVKVLTTNCHHRYLWPVVIPTGITVCVRYLPRLEWILVKALNRLMLYAEFRAQVFWAVECLGNFFWFAYLRSLQVNSVKSNTTIYLTVSRINSVILLSLKTAHVRRACILIIQFGPDDEDFAREGHDSLEATASNRQVVWLS